MIDFDIDLVIPNYITLKHNNGDSKGVCRFRVIPNYITLKRVLYAL